MSNDQPLIIGRPEWGQIRTDGESFIIKSEQKKLVLQGDNLLLMPGDAGTPRSVMIAPTGGDRGLILVPSAGAGAYNALTQSGDQGIFFWNGTLGQGNLTIGAWDGAGGLRIGADGAVDIRSSSTLLLSLTKTGGGARDVRLKLADQTQAWSLATGWAVAGDWSLIEEGIAGDRLYVQRGTGRVGIGTSTPGWRLHVVGDIATSGWVRNTAAGAGLYNEASGYGVYSDSGGLKHYPSNGTILHSKWGQATLLHINSNQYQSGNQNYERADVDSYFPWFVDFAEGRPTYFECFIRTTSASVPCYVCLWCSTENAMISGSEMATTSTSFVFVRSANLGLASSHHGHWLEVRIRRGGTTDLAVVRNSRILIA